ncbi:MAG TPA: EamA family transporter [Candidatus Deferrimicrobium sp.]|nr:EamA family transporter [Candidatus Deferrimicrobium sp.]
MKTASIYIMLCFIWGSTWMTIKIGLTDAPPLYASGLRFVLAITILFAIIALKRYSLPATLSETLRLGYPGLYMYGASYGFIYSAEQYLSSSLTAVLFASFPFFVALLSSWVLKVEKLRLAAWVGLFIGLSGIVVIFRESLQVSGSVLVGFALVLCGSLAAAYGMLLHKKHFADRNIYVSAGVQMTVGGIPILLAAFLLEPWTQFSWSPATVGSILYLAIFGSVIAFVAYYWLLSHTRAVTVSLIAFITPLVALLVGCALYGETLSWHTGLGAGLILVGVALVVSK